MLHWWGFSPGHRGKSRQNEQSETQPRRENKRQRNKTTENKNKNIKRNI